MCVGCGKPRGEEQRSGAHHDVSTNAMGIVRGTRAKPVSAAPDMPSINITVDTLRSNILYSTERGRFVIADFDKYVAPELFATDGAYTSQSLYLLCRERMKDMSNTKRARAYCDTLLSLRYRTLLPLLKEHILSAVSTNDFDRAHIAVSMLYRIAHPDTLRTFLEIDAALPSNSVLRIDRYTDPSFPNNMPIWTTSLPLFTRPDCLPIYLDIVYKPQAHRFGRWYDAVERVQDFTNATAVAGLRYALNVVKNPGVYWPDMGPSLYILAVEVKLDDQRDYIRGKRNLPRTDTVVFDE